MNRRHALLLPVVAIPGCALETLNNESTEFAERVDPDRVKRIANLAAQSFLLFRDSESTRHLIRDAARKVKASLENRELNVTRESVLGFLDDDESAKAIALVVIGAVEVLFQSYVNDDDVRLSLGIAAVDGVLDAVGEEPDIEVFTIEN